MKLTIDGEVFEFDASRMTNVEGMAIEKATGLLYAEWAEALSKGSMMAQTALVWVIKKRQEPTLRFDDVVFTTVEIDDGDEQAEQADASDPAIPTEAAVFVADTESGSPTAA